MRPDIGALEVSLSELQKVGDELAATFRHRNCGSARIIYRPEVSLAPGRTELNI